MKGVTELVAVDGSQHALRALDEALAIAKSLGGSVDVVTVLDLGHVYAYEGLGIGRLPSREWQDELKREVLDAALNRVLSAGVARHGVVLNGPVVRTLLQHIDELSPRMVVVGRSGKGAIDAALGGIVSRASRLGAGPDYAVAHMGCWERAWSVA
jgi:nucleotide-binding universal stress UspA family protein